jgi:ornithine cyclodeaminase/alanine dehydrogenase-like protein (mu-crystallin family)
MQHLANPSPSKVAVVGTGAQARSQLALLAAIGCTATVVVGGRDLERAAAIAGPGIGVDTIENAVRDADVVFCCTGAREPVVRREWLAPGAHVSSIGGSHGHEIDAETVRDGTVFAEWPGAASSPPPAGAYEIQGRDVVLLGSVVDGRHPGRRDRSELTVYKSTGHAALDVAAASVVLGR